jgi:hypothetical protein
MNAIRAARWLFGSNAVINWAISIPGILDPTGYAQRFGAEPRDMAFLVRLWLGLIFMFGLLFWEVSRDPVRKQALAKYNWIEKTITATAITLGFAAGQVPLLLMLTVVATNWLWIPFILWNDIALRRTAKPTFLTPSRQAVPE